MNNEDLSKENEDLKKRIIELEDNLKKYKNSHSHKRYYEKNKDKIKEKANEYLKKLSHENPDKLKEYRHRAYLKQKEKKSVANSETI
jgi:cell division septum initiation protein DivIVA